MAQTATAEDIAFVGGFEGFASCAYRCPAGVITIGFGFTMGSKVFADWWRHKYDRALRMGDTITREDSDAILKALFENEYGAAVTRKIGPLPHHQWAGAGSTAFNCGIGSLAWRWAQALKRGAVQECAGLLRVTAVTANGRKLAGLVRRRAAEATLIATGSYGKLRGPANLTPSVSQHLEDVKWYQAQLKRLGYDLKVTGDRKAADSDRAVRKFQRDHALQVDGKVGPATRATIIRALDAKAHAKATGRSGGLVGGAKGGADYLDQPHHFVNADMLLHVLYWGFAAAVIVGAVYLIWRYRGRVTGRRVPT